MKAPDLIDFHNHFNFLPGWINSLTETFLGNQNSLDFLLGQLSHTGQKMVIGHALYAMPWYRDGLGEVLRYVKLLEQLGHETKNEIKIIKTKEDLYSEYKIGIVLHIESARWFYSDLTTLDRLQQSGVFGIIPIHYLSNWFGGSCDDVFSKFTCNTYQKDLTDQGKKLLDRMMKLKMWLDVSHMNDRTLRSSLEHFDGAVVASHIGLRKVINVDRNLGAESIDLINQKKGMIGVCAWSRITGKEHAQLKQMIDHLLDKKMEDQIFIGSDFGPPIHTAHGVKNIFNFFDVIKSVVGQEIAKKVSVTNALKFYEQALPD
jgi:microsomal dipeptidase-like Zn-dependent dipeptidase